MNILENIREALRSIRANMLRTVLTALIIAIGITSLVGILTAVDGMQSSVNNNFASLGANSFDIKNPNSFRRRRQGVSESKFPPIDYREAKLFKEKFGYSATISLFTGLTGSAEVKYLAKKTNPNSRLMAGDENYVAMKGYKIADGRNFSKNDIENSMNVAILGTEITRQIFDKENPVGKEISVLGQKFKIIGIFEKKGSLSGTGDDRVMVIPLETGRNLAGERRKLTIDITTSVPDIKDLDLVMEEARGIMRNIRQDRIGSVDSFTIQRADSFAKSFEEISGKLRVGGGVISLITLIGAIIALMNIMLVSVTERTREIGIRKSLGATPSTIREQFLIEAIVICLLGGIGGIILGISIGNLVSQLISERSSFIVPWLWMMLAIAVCIIVGILSGFYPAWKASKLDPIESLRYE